jgi:hypothetical protein
MNEPTREDFTATPPGATRPKRTASPGLGPPPASPGAGRRPGADGRLRYHRCRRVVAGEVERRYRERGGYGFEVELCPDCAELHDCLRIVGQSALVMVLLVLAGLAALLLVSPPPWVP